VNNDHGSSKAIVNNEVLFKTWLTSMGYVVVANIYPLEVEERNNSQSKVISQILVLGT
jgi:hypothetical protein